ncbi:MAG: helix-turn-helix domain-containing protein [Terracidiphilus sp.]
METVAHWTQNSTTDFVYSISSNFIAQIETKIEAEDISQSKIASKMGKTDGRVSQVLNNPGNLSIRVMVELARALGMKVSIVAYDDHDHDNDRGPIDPDVFVKCWEHAGRPSNLIEAEDSFEPKNLAVSTDFVYTKWAFDQGPYANLIGPDNYVAGIWPEKFYYGFFDLSIPQQREEVPTISSRQPVIPALMMTEKREEEAAA